MGLTGIGEYESCCVMVALESCSLHIFQQANNHSGCLHLFRIHLFAIGNQGVKVHAGFKSVDFKDNRSIAPFVYSNVFYLCALHVVSC